MRRLDAALVLGWALKLALGAVFAAAAVPKLGDPAGFAEEIANYRLLPQLAPAGAAALPGVELVLAAVLLLLGLHSRWVQAAAAVATGLMLLFTVAVTQVVIRGIDIDCGCFGGGSGAVTAMTVTRDVLLTLACAALCALSCRRARLTSA